MYGGKVNNRFVDNDFLVLFSNKQLFRFLFQTRLMNQKSVPKNLNSTQLKSHRIYKGSIDCFIQTVRNEGFGALYKGFIPTWFRMGPWNVIFFITYEQLKQFY